MISFGTKRKYVLFCCALTSACAGCTGVNTFIGDKTIEFATTAAVTALANFDFITSLNADICRDDDTLCDTMWEGEKEKLATMRDAKIIAERKRFAIILVGKELIGFRFDATHAMIDRFLL